MALEPITGSRWTRIGVPIGAGVFIAALAGSAYAVPQLRALHFFQSLIYVAVILLARRASAWGFGAGTTIAVAWNGLQLFVTRLALAGTALIWTFLRTGQARRIDTMMVSLGTVGHFVLIVSCLAAFLQLAPRKRDWWRFLGGGAVVMGYFALIVATLLPR